MLCRWQLFGFLVLLHQSRLSARWCCRRKKKPKYVPHPRAVPDMAAVYNQHRLGDAPANLLFPDDILAVIVEQTFTAYCTEDHSLASAVMHTARDLSRLAQGSKAMHTTVMAAWLHLARILDTQLDLVAEAVAAKQPQGPHAGLLMMASLVSEEAALLRDRLPSVAGLDWVSIPGAQAFLFMRSGSVTGSSQRPVSDRARCMVFARPLTPNCTCCRMSWLLTLTPCAVWI